MKVLKEKSKKFVVQNMFIDKKGVATMQERNDRSNKSKEKIDRYIARIRDLVKNK